MAKYSDGKFGHEAVCVCVVVVGALVPMFVSTVTGRPNACTSLFKHVRRLILQGVVFSVQYAGIYAGTMLCF